MSKGCTCEKCIEMCRTYPCMPLPEEALKLVRAGYGKPLMLDTLNWGKGERGKILALRPAMKGYEHDLAPMEIGKSPCVFLQDDRCTLHKTGLKPYEGRFCRHDTIPEQEKGMMETLKEAWNTEAGATCENNRTAMAAINSMSKNTHDFNERFRIYQNAARVYQCLGYQPEIY